MNIYFYSPKGLDSQVAREIIFFLKKAGIVVISDNSKNKQMADDGILPKAEAMIFLGQSLDARASYLLAFHLAQNKKVLCLLPSGSEIDAGLSSLKSSGSLSQKLMLEFYTAKNILEKVSDFLKKLDQRSAKELFNIKFTLRLSHKILDYINWRSAKDKTPKADWLRLEVKKMMEKDEKYQDWIKKKFDLDK